MTVPWLVYTTGGVLIGIYIHRDVSLGHTLLVVWFWPLFLGIKVVKTLWRLA